MSEDRYTLNQRFADLKCCVIIPTYNNEKTLSKVISDTLQYTDKIIVVNDGATDSTPKILETFGDSIKVLTHAGNLGKGMALRDGFKKSVALGYDYAITIDSDGQHFPSDLENFLNKIEEHPGSLIIGARNMNSENVPGKSSFGHKFSNFWFQVETGIKMPDTQSGYRLYPVKKLEKLNFFSPRFEFEIEVIVKSAWRGIPVISMPIKIFYAKGAERISHFRPAKDFTRISILNTYLVILAFSWYKPLRFFRGLTPANLKAFIQKHFFNKDESVLKKSLSVSLGIFFGIVPIWGYQLVAAIAASYLFKLNKAIVILTANISIPPLLPFILIASVKTGELFTGTETDLSLRNISLKTLKLNAFTYLAGACILAVLFSLFMGLTTFITLSVIRKKKS
ncbi:glycosyltransferase [Sphingobacteriaceae bacterium]|nr:glycosyltransferase [Sphingobacteriaceae bacterium]